MRLLKNYLDIEREVIDVRDQFVPDPAVRIRKKSSYNSESSKDDKVLDDTEKEVVRRIRDAYTKLCVKSDINYGKSPDFIIDIINEEYSKRGKNTKFISITKKFGGTGYKAAITYASGAKVEHVTQKMARKLSVALLLLLEEVIS